MFVMAGRILAIAVISIAMIVVGVILLKNIGSSGKKSARAVLIALICVLAAGFVFSFVNLFTAMKVIGTYSGVEYDRITINGVTYQADYQNDYSSRDAGRLLGRATCIDDSGPSDPMYIYNVHGTDEYIYALWVYDGTFFKKV